MNNAAIHALLDIALNTPRETADVFFNIHSQCTPRQVSVDIHVGGWSPKINPQFTRMVNFGESEALLSDVQAFIASINPAESKRKAAQERLKNARAELLAAEVEAGALNAWTPESGEPCPMEELHKFSVTEEQIEAHEAMEDFNRPDLRWQDSQEAEDHNDRSKPL